MSADRHEHLGAAAAVQDTAQTRLRCICDVCAGKVAVTGARVRILGTTSTHEGGGLVCSSDALGVRLEDLAITAGVTPGTDALESGRPVLVPDLNADGARWPRFAPAAIAAGVAAVFSFPLRTNGTQLGVLELHRAAAGSLTLAQLTEALSLADAAATTIIHTLNPTAPTTLAKMVDIHPEVHQATGMVAVRLETSLQEALSHIRRHAFDHHRDLTEVAEDIVERRLRLDQPQRPQRFTPTESRSRQHE